LIKFFTWWFFFLQDWHLSFLIARLTYVLLDDWVENLVFLDCKVNLIIPDPGLKTRCFLIVGLTWRVFLMTGLIFSFIYLIFLDDWLFLFFLMTRFELFFLWEFSNSRVLLTFSFLLQGLKIELLMVGLRTWCFQIARLIW
jgi:hypothetical protein